MKNKYQVALDVYKYLYKEINETLYEKTGNYFYHTDKSKCENILQELIDNSEKYKWHDLRKMPNDMPKTEYEQYLVDTGNSYHYYRVAKLIDGKFVTYDSEWDEYMELNVERWKYIEEAEDE